MIDLLDENNPTKFNKVTDVYDTTYYAGLDSTNEIEIWFPRKISVTYTKRNRSRIPEKIQDAKEYKCCNIHI